MRNRLHSLFVTICLLAFCQVGQIAFAQAPRTIEVGPHFGGTAYVGDLNVWRGLGEWNWKKLHQLDYDLGALVRYNPNSRWAFRLDYSYLKVNAFDPVTAWRPESMLQFRSTVHDLSLMVEFNFLDYYTGKSGSEISPYLFAGVSGFMFKCRPLYTEYVLDGQSVTVPDDFYLNGDDVNTDYFYENTTSGSQITPAVKNNYSFSIPFGIGCKLSLTKHLATSLEWRMHYTFTDYLDDVSGVYGPDDQHVLLLKDGTIGNGAHEGPNVVFDFTDPTGRFKEGDQRGNSMSKDWFGMVNLSFTWKFVIPDNSACKMNID